MIREVSILLQTRVRPEPAPSRCRDGRLLSVTGYRTRARLQRLTHTALSLARASMQPLSQRSTFPDLGSSTRATVTDSLLYHFIKVSRRAGIRYLRR